MPSHETSDGVNRFPPAATTTAAAPCALSTPQVCNVTVPAIPQQLMQVTASPIAM